MRYFFILISMLLYISTTCADIRINIKDAVNQYLATHFLNATFMFANDNEVLNIGAHGIFSLDGTQLKVNEKMPIASGTKPITAAGILRLQDQNKLNVHDKVSKYFGPKSNIWRDKMPDWANDVSIHHLLTHTSGLPEYYMTLTIDANISLHETNRKIVNFAAAGPLRFTPGTEYQYSNTNFIILGLIIEQISSKPLAQFFDDEFFKPLGMKATHLPSYEESLQIQKADPDRAIYPVRYVAIPTNIKPQLEPEQFHSIFVPYADGGVFSNTRDMVTWYKALHQGKLLSKKSYKMMTTQYMRVPNKHGLKSYTGYGIFISKFPSGDTMIHHSGGVTGAISESGCIIEKNFYFAILGNVSMKIPNYKDKAIDLNNPANQIDIVYFRNAVLQAVEHIN